MDALTALNKIIEEAIYTGGDAGGPYYYQSKGLDKAINDLLKILEIDDKLEVGYDSNNYGMTIIKVKENVWNLNITDIEA